MKVKFKDFEFDSTELILRLNGKIYSLNEKPAQLLALFVNQPDKIHTKNEILDAVWPNRVVTDQVVFQNISLLRALFGDEAIKTFPKKGYQWQLSIQQLSAQAALDNPATEADADTKDKMPGDFDPNESKKNKNKSQTSSFSKWALTGILAFVLLFSLGYRVWVDKAGQELTANQDGLLEQNIYQVTFANNELGLLLSNTELAPQHLFDSPYSSWQQISKTETSRLLALKYYSSGEKVVLRFHLQGKYRGWQDYILADSKVQANNKLNDFLRLLGSSQYLSLESQRGATAELLVLINQVPEHFLFNHQLIKQYEIIKELDRSSALMEQMLATEQNKLEKGLLLLTKIELDMANQNWPLAKQSARDSAQIFEQLALPQLESLALTQSAWPFLVEEAFLAGMQVLNQAASKARVSNEPLQEVSAHLIQSFIASKSGHTELMHTQLGLARELITLHRLGQEHMVPVHYNLAWIGKSDNSSAQHFQSILDLPFSIQYESYFYIAAEKLRDDYIKKQDWQMAQTYIMDWQRQSFQSLSQAKILFAKGEQDEATETAIKAYRQAQMEHHKLDSLEAALAILQFQQTPVQASVYKEYSTFIRQNATRRWLQQNRASLDALNQGKGLAVTL